MLENIKKACCVSGNCDLVAKQEDVRETLELLAERLKLPTGNFLLNDLESLQISGLHCGLLWVPH